jgi:hypothetical protein
MNDLYPEKLDMDTKEKTSSDRILEAYMKVLNPSLNEDVKDTINDPKIKKEIFRELEKETDKFIMNNIIPKMGKIEDDIYKKYKINKNSNMEIPNLGNATIHDIFSQLIGQSMLTVNAGIKRIKL